MESIGLVGQMNRRTGVLISNGTESPASIRIDLLKARRCRVDRSPTGQFQVPENEAERCTVCLCEFETGEEVRNLRCTHIFHVNCIDKWLVYNKKCPVCRLDVDKQKAVLVE
ncbi:unnamed protein product [Heligmosomoides polygyrus]|uniref:RING-type domain-containing protein n=1 Tax=Heligmosomoides polygyrus TaxID=6339 RepID=A0A3P8D5B5_HELPZ|nr:unnamed protein product [Heligmosomoides polygyrus]